MSYYMTGEKLKFIDIFLILITFIGVSLITYGFSSANLNFGDEVEEHEAAASTEEDSHHVPILVYIGTFSIPFLLSYGNILMYKMKGLHENTVSMYINPVLGFTMLIVMLIEGESVSFLSDYTWVDWILTIFFSIGTVLVQTLKYLAL